MANAPKTSGSKSKSYVKTAPNGSKYVETKAGKQIALKAPKVYSNPPISRSNRYT